MVGTGKVGIREKNIQAREILVSKAAQVLAIFFRVVMANKQEKRKIEEMRSNKQNLCANFVNHFLLFSHIFCI